MDLGAARGSTKRDNNGGSQYNIYENNSGILVLLMYKIQMHFVLPPTSKLYVAVRSFEMYERFP